MSKKVDFALTLVILLFGILYCIFTFTWFIAPGKLNIGTMYFPAIALMYLFAGLFNIVRLKIDRKLTVGVSVLVNFLLFIYAAYLTYLVKVAIPPFIATSVLAVVLLLSALNLRSTNLVGAKA